MTQQQMDIGSVIARRSLLDIELKFFLRMGYFPHYKSPFKLDYMNITPHLYDDWYVDDLKAKGIELFRAAIAENYEAGRRHVVPLSGGLDSRAILAALLEFTEPHNIETYTFGVPGSYDYDIGRAVAQTAGVKHYAFDLSDYAWSQDDLLEQSRLNDCQTFLFHHVPAPLLKQFKGSVIWSGYIGDLVCGGHSNSFSGTSRADARRHYLSKRSESKSFDLHGKGDALDEMTRFVSGDVLLDEYVSTYESVMFNEVENVTAPHVLCGSADYKTPFVNNDFFDWAMSLPKQYRSNRNLFVSMMRDAYPLLFSLPSKDHYGLSYRASSVSVGMARAKNKMLHLGQRHLPFLPLPSSPNVNYFDFNKALRRNDYLREIAKSNIADLQARQMIPWVDAEAVLRRHLSGLCDYGDAIKMLMSLELNMKACGK